MQDTFTVTDWTEYFVDFSQRNIGRPARLEIFGMLGALLEVRSFPFSGISVEMDAPNSPLVEIHFGGLSARKSENLTHTVPFVSSIMAMAQSDKIENAVEFETADGSKTLLSFEAVETNSTAAF